MQNRKTPDLLTVIAVLAFLALTAFLAVANVWFGKTLADVGWLSVPLGVAIGALGRHCLGNNKQDEPPAIDVREEFLSSDRIILLVEDSQTIIDGITSYFRRLRFRGLRVANSCEQALSMVKEEQPYTNQGLPDLIILDMVWKPGMMSGSDFIKTIRKDSNLCDLKVLALTAAAKDSFDYDVLQSICCFVPKGRMDTLLEALIECSLPKHPKRIFNEKKMSISQRMQRITQAITDKEASTDE